MSNGGNGQNNANGSLVTIDDASYYRIDHVEHMAPFLISISSSSDLWMWITSTGALTAGRKDANHAIFPYRTDDVLYNSVGYVGPVTAIKKDNVQLLWRPFVVEPYYPITRSLYKCTIGDAIIFEEYHTQWDCTFQYSWYPSHKFGWVRHTTFRPPVNDNSQYTIVDGVVDVMPAGIAADTEQLFSNLVDSYKRTESNQDDSSALYTVESLITDKAEPAEALSATLVWSNSANLTDVHISREVFIQFISHGIIVPQGLLVCGQPGCYILSGTVESSQPISWDIVLDTDIAQHEVLNRVSMLKQQTIAAALANDRAASRAKLIDILTKGDGFQTSGDSIADAHHLSNVLYNSMRGGICAQGYTINLDDFLSFVLIRNKPVARTYNNAIRSAVYQHNDFNTDMHTIPLTTLRSIIKENNNAQLERIWLEYLPLTFSRRHGDPSRPWNNFSINIQDNKGEDIFAYEGNWRDIFQNWEAMLRSFPYFIPHAIAKFVNASTVDGYNPYKINQRGIEWDQLDPSNPWANIGYWGDHQINYLIRLLELWQRYDINGIQSSLLQPLYSYANVPYRLASHEDMLANPRHTVSYDHSVHSKIEKSIPSLGTDAKLLQNRNGLVVQVTLLEKLMIPALAKIVSYIPGGGIWMNTQRPEWNDANNALVGYGVSMVTLFYLHRYIYFIKSILKLRTEQDISLSQSVVEWVVATLTVLKNHSPQQTNSSAENRKKFIDDIGLTGTQYRTNVYSSFDTTPTPIQRSELIAWCETACTHLHFTISTNKRSDLLYNSYNILKINETSIEIEPLPEMLEGQVAAIASGCLSSDEVVSLGTTLFDSALYVEDRKSFVLYPYKYLPSFIKKNTFSIKELQQHALDPLPQHVLNNIITKDSSDAFHFTPHCSNVQQLLELASQLEIGELAQHSLSELYEEIFNHRAFTGRSGTMYKFEGIGSIYWHMVSKLQLAVMECYQLQLKTDPTDIENTNALADLYRRIRDGLGYRKTPSDFGATPTDCYSHTPQGMGAQQPGMTGQVKEEIICRYGELGICVTDQTVYFNSSPIPYTERVQRDQSTLQLSFCGVPFNIKYENQSTMPQITIVYSDSRIAQYEGHCLHQPDAKSLFARDGRIAAIEVNRNSS